MWRWEPATAPLTGLRRAHDTGIVLRVNPGEAMRGVMQRHTEQPRTVLGFYAISAGIMFSGIIGLISVLGWTGEAEWLIPFLAIAAILIFVAVIAGVFIVNVKAPEKLMLGRVSGSEFVEIQRVQLGDGQFGERIELLPKRRSLSPSPGDAVIVEVEAEIVPDAEAIEAAPDDQGTEGADSAVAASVQAEDLPQLRHERRRDKQRPRSKQGRADS